MFEQRSRRMARGRRSSPCVAAGCASGDERRPAAPDGRPTAGDHRRRRGREVDECDWASYGNGPARTFSLAAGCETTISPDTVGDLAEAWFFNTDDVVTATPAVAGGTVFVGDWAGTFYAIDAETGEERWRHETEPHPTVYSGQIVSSAAVAEVDGRTLVYFGGGKTLYALDAGDRRGGVVVRHRHLRPRGRARRRRRDARRGPPDRDPVLAARGRRQGDRRVRRPRPARVPRRGRSPSTPRTGELVWDFDPDQGAEPTGCGGRVELAERRRRPGPRVRRIGQLQHRARRVGRVHRGALRPRPRHRRAAVELPAPPAEQRRHRPAGRTQPLRRWATSRRSASAARTATTTRSTARPASCCGMPRARSPSWTARTTASAGSSGRWRSRTGSRWAARPARAPRPAPACTPSTSRPARSPGRPRSPNPSSAPRPSPAAWCSPAAPTSRSVPSTWRRATSCGPPTCPGWWPAGSAVVGDDVFAVAGIREPGGEVTAESAGVFRFTLDADAATDPTGTRPPTPRSPAYDGPVILESPEQECVGSPCEVRFTTPTPPAGLDPDGHPRGDHRSVHGAHDRHRAGRPRAVGRPQRPERRGRRRRVHAHDLGQRREPPR